MLRDVKGERPDFSHGGRWRSGQGTLVVGVGGCLSKEFRWKPLESVLALVPPGRVLSWSLHEIGEGQASAFSSATYWGKIQILFLGHFLSLNLFFPPRSDLNILGKRVLWEEWRGILGIAAGEMSCRILCPDRVGTHPSETRHTARRRVEPRCSSLSFIPFWNKETQVFLMKWWS